MVKVQAHIGNETYTTSIKTSTHEIIADEPKDKGGLDLGFSPSELLAASLSACTSVTLRMYANRKGWDLQGITTDVSFERDTVNNTSQFTVNIRLEGNLSPEERSRLLHIAKSCPIHKTLTNPIQIETELL